MPITIRPTFAGTMPRITRPVNSIDRFKLIPLAPNTFVDGVFEGGAALGTAYLGSLRLLEQSRIWFKRVAGNSAGAITASLVAAGYTANEIEWLSSAYPNPPARPSGIHRKLEPIDFLEFLDFPTLNTIGVPARRKTNLWRAIKGQVIDEILNQKLPVPTRKQTENDIVTGLKGIPLLGSVIGPAERFIRDMLKGVLGFLPTKQPKIKDFQLFDTEALRIAFADAVWSAVASVDPTLVMSTQLLYEGSMFEGRVAYDTIHRFLGAKVHNNPTADVLFKQLPIPLAVIGANIKTGRMEVYSVQTHPNMIVAEAVRRSMSLPVIFEPRGNFIVDGGLCSNFPAWLFSSAGNRFWPSASVDANRPKIGFTLDETVKPDSRWGVSAGKFQVSGDPPSVPLEDVLIPTLIAKLEAQDLYSPSGSLPRVDLIKNLADWKLLKVIAGSVTMNQEDSVRKVILRGLFANQPFFHVNIPLLGFHGFDFAINSDKDDLESIAERGWYAARASLAEQPVNGAPLIANPAALQNPY